MRIMDLLLPALSAVVCPDPGVERVFIAPKIAGGLHNRLIRLDRQLHRALLAFGGITFHR
jgi:hypothetical protein